MVKDEILAFVIDFFSNSRIPSGCNSSFITLIPKIDSPVLVSDFPSTLLEYNTRLYPKFFRCVWKMS